MDYGAVITESVEYTRDALWGKWVRWLIFIICGLPMALFPFVFNAKEIFTGKDIHWELIHWDQLAAIFIAAFLLSFIVSGYIVRIYRGTKPAPEFDNWGPLYLDGIKVAVVSFIWFIPLIFVVAVLLGITIFGLASSMATGSTASIGLILGLMLLTILVEMIVLVIIMFFSILGVIRFARTGSIREGIRFS